MRFIGLPKRKQRTTLLANRSSDATPLRIPSSISASSRETKPLSHFKHACRHKRASSSSNRKQYDRKARSNDIPARMPRASASIISGAWRSSASSYASFWRCDSTRRPSLSQGKTPEALLARFLRRISRRQSTPQENKFANAITANRPTATTKIASMAHPPTNPPNNSQARSRFQPRAFAGPKARLPQASQSPAKAAQLPARSKKTGAKTPGQPRK